MAEIEVNWPELNQVLRLWIFGGKFREGVQT
jgi:hypothetical protein